MRMKKKNRALQGLNKIPLVCRGFFLLLLKFSEKDLSCEGDEKKKIQPRLSGKKKKKKKKKSTLTKLPTPLKSNGVSLGLIPAI